MQDKQIPETPDTPRTPDTPTTPEEHDTNFDHAMAGMGQGVALGIMHHGNGVQDAHDGMPPTPPTPGTPPEAAQPVGVPVPSQQAQSQSKGTGQDTGQGSDPVRREEMVQAWTLSFMAQADKMVAALNQELGTQRLTEDEINRGIMKVRSAQPSPHLSLIMYTLSVVTQT